MPDYKMTATLLGALDWINDCPANWKDRAFEGLKNNLTQGFSESTATLRGQAYERKICSAFNAGLPLETADKAFEFARGMRQQVWMKPLYITVDKMTFVFRGKMDFVGELDGRETVCDLKTTKGRIDRAKYYASKQHLIYCLAGNLTDFVYMVARFDDDEGLVPSETDVIPVTVDPSPAKAALVNAVFDFVTFLRQHDLWDAYDRVFCGHEG